MKIVNTDIPHSFCKFTDSIHHLPGFSVRDFRPLSGRHRCNYPAVVQECVEWAAETFKDDEIEQYLAVKRAAIRYCRNLEYEIFGEELVHDSTSKPDPYAEVIKDFLPKPKNEPVFTAKTVYSRCELCGLSWLGHVKRDLIRYCRYTKGGEVL